MNNEELLQIRNLAGLIRNAKNCLAFTGAGISTLSNIPDFRSSDGIYSKQFQRLDVETILSLSFFRQKPEYFYRWSKTFVYNLDRYYPNVVHRVLAKLEAQTYLNAVYTQNIDQLHTKAGSKRVYELHGSAATHHCLECGAEFSYDEIAPLVQADVVPRCHNCHGLIKPDIIFYEEPLKEDILEHGFAQMECADLVLVLGSSLVVQPAASLPLTAAQRGAKIVIVNAQETMLDRYATLKFTDLGSVFAALEMEFA